MSIAEKLTAIAENTPKVFNAGYKKGKAEGNNTYTDDYIISLVNRQMTEFSIPEGCTIIGHSAFRACTKLTSLHIPDTITIIKNDAFALCYELKIELPDGVTSIGNGAFSSNGHQIITKLPLELKTIGDAAFQYCGSPFTLSEIPEKVESIGKQAFQNCTGFTELTFKGTPTSIATNAFQGCTNLLDIYVPWSEGEVANAPWGATNATIHYNSEVSNAES